MRRILVASLLILAIAKLASAQTFRDPMRPAGAAAAAPRAAAPAALRLEGVIDGPQRVAIVSGRLVRAGDVVNGAQVLEIFPNGVRLSRAGKVVSLTLPAEPMPGTVRIAEAKKP